jgi:hypothetical protein
MLAEQSLGQGCGGDIYSEIEMLPCLQIFIGSTLNVTHGGFAHVTNQNPTPLLERLPIGITSEALFRRPGELLAMEAR